MPTNFTADDLAALERAIAGGELIVAYSDKRVQYRGLRDMMITRDLIRRELGMQGNTGSRIYLTHKRD